MLDLKETERSILAAGGGKTVHQKNGYVHIVVYSRSYSGDRHMSYDLYPDGHVENVHTDKDGIGYITYGGGF